MKIQINRNDINHFINDEVKIRNSVLKRQRNTNYRNRSQHLNDLIEFTKVQLLEQSENQVDANGQN